MNIAIDTTPLRKDHFLQHRVRGTGFYIENLKRALLKYFPQDKYIFITRGEKVPKDINLIHYPYFEPFFLTLPFKKQTKTVVTVHDLIPLVFPDYFPSGIKGKIKWLIQKYSLRQTNEIITDSQSSKRDIIKYTDINSEKVHVVYLAAGENFRSTNDNEIKTDIIRKLNLPKDYILYVGDATWNKNLPRLAKAIKKINLPLVMVGQALVNTDIDANNPWNRDLIEVKNLIKNEPQIILTGFVSENDLICLYQSAKVFIMPSLYEGFGLPVLEALSCGCPVITAEKGSLEEIAGDAPFYINPYSEDDIANGISTVYYNDALRSEMINKGIIQSKKFTWQKTAAATMAVYEKTI
ncbi:MAG: glycosyltransferase family 1 protein [Candidatus Gottesmanbacteria bacterium]